MREKEPVSFLFNILTIGASLYSLYEISKFSLNKKQREAILDRDDHTSQLRTYSEEEGWHNAEGYCEDEGATCQWLHVHHIEPQRTGGSDDSTNVITLFACQHIGYCPGGRIKPEWAIR